MVKRQPFAARTWRGLLLVAIASAPGVLTMGQEGVGAPVAAPPAAGSAADTRPSILRQRQPNLAAQPTTAEPVEESFLLTPFDPPLGFAGPSGLLPSEEQTSSHFVPVEDRWRLGFPEWDRYDKGHPAVDDYPYVRGNIWDPFNQNVLKGDYPLIGQNTFLNVTAISDIIIEPRQVPTATTPFESTARPNSEDFFGRPNQFFYVHNLSVSFDLNHGDAAFKPTDWRARITPVFNFNYLDVEELGVTSPDVRKGTTRARTFTALQEWFIEKKIADLSPDYDFISMRAGSQPFVSDFRGFIFADTNRGLRLFGTRLSNRDQFNLVYFDQQEKDTNSFLNTLSSRQQRLLMANYYRQDFLIPGYISQWSVQYNHDDPSFKFDKNGFLVRPDPVGTFQEHQLDVCYLGWAGDGHIGRYNISHQFYWALGYDTQNPLANRGTQINGQMAAIELSYDRDWARLKGSFFYSSGDNNINDRQARGFDTILDNPNFAGGQFSYWQRQQIKLFGVNLVQRESLVPNLRSSKFQGQSNFVNPGLFLINGGVDVEVTPKLRWINNANYLWFDKTNVLEQFVFQENIHRDIGLDLSTGFEYRPLLNNNIIVVAGVSSLLPGSGFRDLFNTLNNQVTPLFAGFMNLVLTY